MCAYRLYWLVILCCLAIPAAAQTGPVFITVPAGRYTVGQREHMVNPRRSIALDSFSIAATETTNAQFAAFVAATGYVTDAERNHRAMVFEPGLKEFEWIQDSTAYWRYPNGITRGGIEGKEQHPVTAISFADAEAYCAWAGVRLPALDEWEIAARAGSRTEYFWGDDREPIRCYANIWQGRNHLIADSSDGWMYTAPVASFEPNPLGLYDVYGNVFEFCSGALPADKSDNTVHARGGSWWCSKNSCGFFNSTDIGKVNRHASFSNQGFRVARSLHLR